MDYVTTIFGAPGCGKTHYLLDLLEDLLKHYAPDEIAFVSFTRQGSYEGRSRAMERFEYHSEQLPYFRTLHSLAFTGAGLSKSDIIQKAHYKEFSDLMGMNFTGYYTEDFNSDDDRLLFYYFLKKNNPTLAEEIEGTINMGVYERVEMGYNKYKEVRGLVDYTDMLTFFLESKQALPVKVAIIDEAQDLTTLQWQMCEIAFKNCEHVFIAGDDDQAIYEWNGADVNYFLSLKGDRVILDKSYRMPKEVLRFSKKIASLIDNRVPKEFAPRAIGGSVELYNDLDEIPLKKNETYYFLARTNWHLARFRTYFKENGIVYTDKGNSSVSEKVVQAIRAYEYFRKNGTFAEKEDALLLTQLVIDPTNYKLPWYENFGLDIEELNYYRDLVASKADLLDRRFLVSTIHGVKGGEADNVVMLLDLTKNIETNFYTHRDSELRCFYVGCTRARKRVHLVASKSRRGYDSHLRIQNLLYGD